jgi:N-carbamoyl-L-amino-acid hydrolase
MSLELSRRGFLASAMGGFALAGGYARGAAPAQQRPLLRVDADRLAVRLADLSQFGRNADGGIDRVAYSDADLAARRWVMEQMRAASLEVRIDAAGNIIGRRAGRDANLPCIMTGSHIDSVPGGGNYDGQVGSMGALEVAACLQENRVVLRHPLEVVIFQNEENGKVGSKAVRGEDPALYLDLGTHSGKTVREGIRFIGGDPDRVRAAERRRGEIHAFLELHIEQGGVLEQSRIAIGIVEGIVGIKRWAITVQGFANHAGTTPMDQRQDALLAAARLIDAANRITRSAPGRQVATVGALRAEPGAPNVIAGRATLTLEMRDLDLATVDGLFAQIRAESDAIARATGTTFEFREIYKTLPAQTDAGLRGVLADTARALSLSTLSLPSGAGHDAQEIAQLARMGMIFVPSRGGISHSPQEFSSPRQIADGADVLLNAIMTIDGEV